jgi:hypothetical protein
MIKNQTETFLLPLDGETLADAILCSNPDAAEIDYSTEGNPFIVFDKGLKLEVVAEIMGGCVAMITSEPECKQVAAENLKVQIKTYGAMEAVREKGKWRVRDESKRLSWQSHVHKANVQSMKASAKTMPTKRAA